MFIICSNVAETTKENIQQVHSTVDVNKDVTDTAELNVNTANMRNRNQYDLTEVQRTVKLHIH